MCAPKPVEQVPRVLSWFACSVIVLNIYHRTPSTSTMPPWVQKLFMHKLPVLLRMDRPFSTRQMLLDETERNNYVSRGSKQVCLAQTIKLPHKHTTTQTHYNTNKLPHKHTFAQTVTDIDKELIKTRSPGITLQGSHFSCGEYNRCPNLIRFEIFLFHYAVGSFHFRYFVQLGVLYFQLNYDVSRNRRPGVCPP